MAAKKVSRGCVRNHLLQGRFLTKVVEGGDNDSRARGRLVFDLIERSCNEVWYVVVSCIGVEGPRSCSKAADIKSVAPAWLRLAVFNMRRQYRVARPDSPSRPR